MVTSSSKNFIFHLIRCAALPVVCFSVSPASAQSLVTNGTFEEAIDPWWGYTAEEFIQTVDVLEGRMCSTIEVGGENYWDVIIGLSDLALVAGQNYRISFSASSDVDRSIRFKTGLGDAPYTDYFLRTIKLTATPQTFESTYLNLREDAVAQFQFHIGGTPGVVCFDDIIIEPVAAPIVPPYTTPSLTGHALKDYKAIIKMGTAVDTPTFLSQPAHNAILTGEFSMFTPANSMKMNIIQGTQGVFDWVETDALLAFAEANAMEFHGHPLVWHTQAPAWLEDGEFDRDAMIAVMYAHIDALVGRYVGRIPYWDVVNEAIDKVGEVYDFRSTIWHDRIGPDFIDLAFQRARLVDPNALLLYNDYNIEVMGNAKADRVFELVKDMKTRGIPIDQVGFQGHWYITEDGGSSGLPDAAAVRANMARYEEIGVGVQITEFDVRIGLPITPEKQQTQARVYQEILQACIDAPNCSHFTVWGISDIDSWVPSTFENFDSAHLFDASFVAKPAYHAFTNALALLPADGTVGAGTGGAGSGTGGAGPVVTTPTTKSGCSYEPRPISAASGWRLVFASLLGLALLFRRGLSARARG